MSIKKFLYFSLFYVIIYSCSSNNNSNTDQVDNTLIPVDLSSYFTIDFTALPNYANQDIPNYITKDNTPASNPITDEK